MKKKRLNRLNIKQIWNKYALIVVGNIVFFILLYFFSIRPDNDENRAGELLSMAQSAHARGLNEAATEIYRKVLGDYPETRAWVTAKKQLAHLKKHLGHKPEKPPECKQTCDEIDVEEMLRKGPTIYLATYLADHYNKVPADKAKIKELIIRYLSAAVNQEGIGLKDLRKESEFQDPEFSKAFFELRPVCVLESDWVYDNFSIRNDNFYTWHNVNVEMRVTQGDQKSQKSTRVERWTPGETIEMLEFRVHKGGGKVTCSVELTSSEGKVERTETI